MLKVKNWERFQHFSDRRPVWIKLYREILDDYEMNMLSAEAFKFLVQLWLIAAEDPKLEGNLPNSEGIAFRLRMNRNKVISLLSEVDNFLISDGYQDNIPRALAREETEKRRDREEKTPAARRSQNSNHMPVESVREVLEGFKQLPSFAHMDVQREVDKIELWRSQPRNRKRSINRRFLANWVSKIDPPLATDPGKPAKAADPCAVPGCRLAWVTKSAGLKVCVDHLDYKPPHYREDPAPPGTDPVQQAPPGGAQDLISQLAGSFGKMD